MKFVEYCLNFLTIAAFGYIQYAKAEAEIHVCECEDPKFLGTYTANEAKFDGAQVFSNANEMSFFRHSGFWYLGNLEPWPPETHYRCVEPEGCNYQGDLPPMTGEGEWKGSKQFNKVVVPVMSFSPCSATNEEL